MLQGQRGFSPDYPTNSYFGTYITDFSLLSVMASVTVNGKTYSSPAATDNVVTLEQYGEKDLSGQIVNQHLFLDAQNQNVPKGTFIPMDPVALSSSFFSYDYFGGSILQNGFEYRTTNGTYVFPNITGDTTVLFSAPLTPVVATPEPAAITLVLTGALAILGLARRRRIL